MPHRITRRQFLQTALLLAGGLSACAPASDPTPSPLPTQSPSTETEVLIVGAGIAGLAAAHTLSQAGWSVLVLEARERIGGRLWTDESLGSPFDLGASWIHGVRRNPIKQLADDLGLETIATEFEELWLYDGSGDSLEDWQVDYLYELGAELQSEVDEWAEEAEPGDSLATALDYLWPYYEADEPAWVGQGLRWLITAEVVQEFGADVAALSLTSMAEGGEFGGADVMFPGGYGQVAAGLAASLGEQILLGQQVRAIEQNENGVQILTDTGHFSSLAAIVTVPLGVLQAGMIRFEPPLSPQKQTAIQNLRMGTLNKLGLRFEDVFWPKAAHRLGYMAPNGENGLTFWSLYPAQGEAVLMALAGGEFARTFEQLSEAEAVALAVSNLETMLGQAVPQPIGVVRSAWGGDRFSRGSYSYVPPGANWSAYATLAQPAERLFFAGEATHSDYPATVHGAYLSGVREAERLLALARRNHNEL